MVWNQGIKVEAKIIGIEKAPNGLRKYLGPVRVEFLNPSGQVIQSKLSDFSVDQFGLGDSVGVRCILNKNSCMLDDGWSRWSVTLLLFVMGAVFLSISVGALFLKPDRLGGILLGLFSGLCFFSSFGMFYQALTFKTKFQKIQAVTEEFFYNEQNKLGTNGTSLLKEESYYVRVRFVDPSGRSKKLVLRCPAALTSRPPGGFVEIQYNQATSSAEIGTTPEINYAQAFILFFVGAFVLLFAYLLFFGKFGG